MLEDRLTSTGSFDLKAVDTASSPLDSSMRTVMHSGRINFACWTKVDVTIDDVIASASMHGIACP